ncbi:MAG TPA: NrfD/PsrC family molybdoenzyme membrane anchor subunit, partial [Pyrinomonadaceae bacterium]
LAARRPAGGLYMWSEQRRGVEIVAAGNPHQQNTSAAALLSYDTDQTIPWDWRVSLYTWTKSIAAGAYLVAALLVLSGVMRADSAVWLWGAPVVAGAALALTGLLLVWDLEHPERFYMIFTRPQWKSWLVKGAFVIAGYSLVLAAHFAASLLGSVSAQVLLTAVGIPLAGLTAVYTAYLFAQAKARDMWQNPLLPPHFFVQALLAGAATLVGVGALFAPETLAPLLWTLGAASLLHVLFIWGEVTLAHPTTHARLAVRELTRGRYRRFFLVGLVLSLCGLFAPFGGAPLAPLALAGLLLYEHAYVQAGQSVPLA